MHIGIRLCLVGLLRMANIIALQKGGMHLGLPAKAAGSSGRCSRSRLSCTVDLLSISNIDLQLKPFTI